MMTRLMIMCLLSFGLLLPLSCMSNNGTKDNESLYLAWRDAVSSMPSYSKTTAYTELPEFKALVKRGIPIVPMLEKKVEKNEGLDFILSIAIVRIKGWEEDKTLSTTDMTEYRVRVLERLAAERTQSKE